MSEEHAGDGDDFLRAGIRAAARPYVRAAIEHRETLPRVPHTVAPKHPSRPTLKETPPVRTPETGAHRPVPKKVAAALVAAVVLVAGAAFGMTHFQSKQRVAVSGNDRGSGNSRKGKTTPGTLQHPQAHPGNGVGPNGGGNTSDGTGGSGTGTGTSPGVAGTPGGRQTNPGGPGGPGGAPPPSEVGSADPSFTNANHLLVTLTDGGLTPAGTSNVDSGLVEVGFKDARTHGSGPATIALPDVGATIAGGATAQVHLSRIGDAYTIRALVSGVATGTPLRVQANVPQLAGGNAYTATINLDDMSCTRDYRTTDEPYMYNDQAPPTGRHWTTIGKDNTRDSIVVQMTPDGMTHHLKVNGQDWRRGDISKGTIHFHPPLVGSTHKWVLEYDGFPPDSSGHVTRTFVLWVIG